MRAVGVLLLCACVTTSAVKPLSRAEIEKSNAKRRADAVVDAMALDRCEPPLEAATFAVAARCDEGGAARIRLEDGRTFEVTCAALAALARLSIVEARDGARFASLVPLSQGSAVAKCGGSLRWFSPEKTGVQLVEMKEACEVPDSAARKAGATVEMSALRVAVIERGAVVVPVNAPHQGVAAKCAGAVRDAQE